MITINSYTVTEIAVYNGVARGVENLLKDVENFKKPDVVVENITNAVMEQLCQILEFHQSPIKFTGDQLRKMLETAQQEENK